MCSIVEFDPVLRLLLVIAKFSHGVLSPGGTNGYFTYCTLKKRRLFRLRKNECGVWFRGI